jgi:hypothetical protein
MLPDPCRQSLIYSSAPAVGLGSYPTLPLPPLLQLLRSLETGIARGSEAVASVVSSGNASTVAPWRKNMWTPDPHSPPE